MRKVFAMWTHSRAMQAVNQVMCENGYILYTELMKNKPTENRKRAQSNQC